MKKTNQLREYIKANAGILTPAQMAEDTGRTAGYLRGLASQMDISLATPDNPAKRKRISLPETGMDVIDTVAKTGFNEVEVMAYCGRWR